MAKPHKSGPAGGKDIGMRAIGHMPSHKEPSKIDYTKTPLGQSATKLAKARKRLANSPIGTTTIVEGGMYKVTKNGIFKVGN